jgi:hypothetical protein
LKVSDLTFIKTTRLFTILHMVSVRKELKIMWMNIFENYYISCFFSRSLIWGENRSEIWRPKHKQKRYKRNIIYSLSEQQVPIEEVHPLSYCNLCYKLYTHNSLSGARNRTRVTHGGNTHVLIKRCRITQAERKLGLRIEARKGTKNSLDIWKLKSTTGH